MKLDLTLTYLSLRYIMTHGNPTSSPFFHYRSTIIVHPASVKWTHPSPSRKQLVQLSWQPDIRPKIRPCRSWPIIIRHLDRFAEHNRCWPMLTETDRSEITWFIRGMMGSNFYFVAAILRQLSNGTFLNWYCSLLISQHCPCDVSKLEYSSIYEIFTTIHHPQSAHSPWTFRRLPEKRADKMAVIIHTEHVAIWRLGNLAISLNKLSLFARLSRPVILEMWTYKTWQLFIFTANPSSPDTGNGPLLMAGRFLWFIAA